MKQTTETGKTLIPESHYEALITKVRRKEVREYIMYDWSFEALIEDKPYDFVITLFSSQMTDLLKALGAKEVSKNKFEWDDEEVVGNTLSFNIVHVEDKKGIIREQLSDIKMLSAPSKQEKQDIAWGEDHVGEVVK